MANQTVFTTNKSQAVRLPKPTSRCLTNCTRRCKITKIGHSRLISPGWPVHGMQFF